MLCETIGREFDKGFRSPVCTANQNKINELSERCYYVTLIEKNVKRILINNEEMDVSGACVICTNEKETIRVLDKSGEYKTIAFHPVLINSMLTYEFINEHIYNEQFSGEEQDMYLLRPFTMRHDEKYFVRKLDSDTYSVVSRLMINVDMELNMQVDYFWPCRSRSYLLELLILISNISLKTENTSDKKGRMIQDVLEYLHNNYTERITIEQLTGRFAINRTTLNDEFVKATGCSIIDYLIKLRIDLACTMLRDTRIPISEIMYRVGYNDSSTFWKIFKKKTGISPSEYRNTYCIVE